MCVSAFASALPASQPAQARKENPPLITTKGFETFFQTGRAGEKRASSSAEQHCPLQTTETKLPASPEENRSFPLGFRAEDLWGMPLRTRERKGTSRRGPGQPPLDRASSARPAHRTTARRARSQEVQEYPGLLRAGSGPAPGKSEVSASLPASVSWEISPQNCLELSTEGLDPCCPGRV
jgi:hypothetical protein